MTNILILALQVLTTNAFPYGACDSGNLGFSQASSWNAVIKYVAPTAGVYVVEHIWDARYVNGSVAKTNSAGQTNGFIGCGFLTLNVSSSVSYQSPNGGPIYQNMGYYTNEAGTNTIRCPIMPWERQFFRMRRI